MKMLFVHIAPVSNEHAMNKMWAFTLLHQNQVAVRKAPIASFNAIVINGLNTGVKHFQMSPFLVFTQKTDRFQNSAFSGLFVFISIFEYLRFHSGAL